MWENKNTQSADIKQVTTNLVWEFSRYSKFGQNKKGLTLR